MTTQILLPTGVTTDIQTLNQHDLGQYYMYQMDMLQQIEDLFSSLGIDGWSDGLKIDAAPPVPLQDKQPTEFLVAREESNQLPTHYDASTWQGMVSDDKGYRTYPYVKDMTIEQLFIEVTRQQASLLNVQASATALVNLSRNIAQATQPPDPAPAR